MCDKTLQSWLDFYLQTPLSGIHLGLERVKKVWQCLQDSIENMPLIVTVAGTNGKGSSVAMLEQLCMASNLTVGSYTSPHLFHFHERVKVQGHPLSAPLLIQGFEQVHAASLLVSDNDQPLPLSFFEGSTLMALWVLTQQSLDVMVLEVGLGGRLDAVNVVDADVALITTIAQDHADWLGTDLVEIAREKAGILRGNQWAVIADPQAPTSIEAVWQTLNPSGFLHRAGQGYQVHINDEHWHWQGMDSRLPWHWPQLPWPALNGEWQIQNAAGAVAAMQGVLTKLNRSALQSNTIATALLQVNVLGRQTHVSVSVADVMDAWSLTMNDVLNDASDHTPPDKKNRKCSPFSAPSRWTQWLQQPLRITLDVAHNPQAAQALANWWQQHPEQCPDTLVFSALEDKDIAGVLSPWSALALSWLVFELDPQQHPRAARLTVLMQLAKDQALNAQAVASVQALWLQILRRHWQKRLTHVGVIGSFFAIDAVMNKTLYNDCL